MKYALEKPFWVHFFGHPYCSSGTKTHLDAALLSSLRVLSSYKQKIIQVIRRNQVYFSSSNVSTDTTVIVKD